MKGFEQVDISGDVGLRVWGRGMEELFENAAIGMADLITDTSNIKEEEVRTIHIQAEGIESLLVQWLNELIYIFDTSGFIGKRFRVEIKDNSLRAEVQGGNFDPSRDERRLLLKAATYHGLSLRRGDDRYEAMVIFDI
jgi:SHS2 domain-containing protein